jgi:hypothetical protein
LTPSFSTPCAVTIPPRLNPCRITPFGGPKFASKMPIRRFRSCCVVKSVQQHWL